MASILLISNLRSNTSNVNLSNWMEGNVQCTFFWADEGIFSRASGTLSPGGLDGNLGASAGDEEKCDGDDLHGECEEKFRIETFLGKDTRTD